MTSVMTSDGKSAESDARTTAAAPPQEVAGQVSRDGLGNEVFDVKCCHCKTRLRAPWVGAGVVRCGVCKELLQLKRPDGACATDTCGHGHSKMRTGLGGYQDPAQCICDKIFFFCPAAASFYFAIVLTSLITIGSFVLVAPRLFPNPDTPVGMLLWVLVVYIAMNTFANFYWGASIDPGKPPTDLTSRTRTKKGEGASTGTGDGDAKDGWCDKCDAEKPEGTHHCSRCKRCVYRMDHHCVFLNNCVGSGNHRYFLLFLFWVTVATCFVTVCTYIVVDDMLVTAKIGRIELLDVLQLQGKLPDLKNQLLHGQGVGAFIATVAYPILSLYGNTVGWECVILLLASAVTCILVLIMLMYHLSLTWRGVSQMEHEFRKSNTNPNGKGLSGIRAALTPHGHPWSNSSWMWLVACFWPIPPRSQKLRTA
mmetsp:Transcript_39195/g.63162  ORF Transcript_39195/g.63162 Transcript_39195/m.63162 type:complete len:423 (+) Transcript_39195:1-1269(+)